MRERPGIVLDANILIRAVFGTRVLRLLQKHEDTARFYTADVCFQDAEEYVPLISKDRGLDPQLHLAALNQIRNVVQQVEARSYEIYESAARSRIAPRDPDDWPVLAVALLMQLPIWTEDQDFFGSGVATWTTDRIELYLQSS